MRKSIVVGGIVALSMATIAAQSPTGSPQQNPVQSPTRQAPGAAGPETRGTAQTTLTGCLYNERDVPGRTPNVAEKAGVLEDFILADVTMPAAPSGGSRATTPGVAGTSGTAPTMYKVENIADETLRGLVGKRVEVAGRIDAERGQTAPTPDKGIGPDRINLPEFEASSIKEVTGTCPAKPAGR
jgi:hypothetical protein